MQNEVKLPGSGPFIVEWPVFLEERVGGWRTFFAGGNSHPSSSAEVYLWKQLSAEQRATLRIKVEESPGS